jgi:hypothetical protein
MKICELLNKMDKQNAIFINKLNDICQNYDKNFNAVSQTTNQPDLLFKQDNAR